MEERLIRKLMTSMKCEECGQNYEFGNIDVLGQRDDMWFLRVLCAKCHTHCLVAAVVRKGKAPDGAGDLAGVEVSESWGRKVEADDVLDMHNFLTNFDGDFLSLFGHQERRR